MARWPSSSVEVRGLVIYDIKEVEREKKRKWRKIQEMKWMEKSKKSQETLDTRLRHDDDKGLNQLHSRSPSVSSHFTNCWVSLCTSWRQFQLFSLLHLLIFDLFAYSLWRFKMRKRVFWGVLFTHSVGCSKPPSFVNDAIATKREQ